jgi:hypothetical protein
MKEMFTDILGRDEHIINVFKPNKKRYWKTVTIWLPVPVFLPHMLIAIALTLGTVLIWGPILYRKKYKNR